MYSSRRKRPTSHRYHSKHYAPSLSYRRFNLAYHQQRGLTMDISPSTAKQTPIHMPTYQSTQAEIQKIYESGIIDKMYPDFPGGIMPIQYVVSTLDDWNLDPSHPSLKAVINVDTWNTWVQDPVKMTSFGFPAPTPGWHWVVDIVNITYTPFDASLRNFRFIQSFPTEDNYVTRTLIDRGNDLYSIQNADSDVNLPPLNFTTVNNIITIFEYDNISQQTWTISKNTLTGIRDPLGEIFYSTLGYIPYMTNRPEVMNLTQSQRYHYSIEIRPDSTTLAELPVVDTFTFELVGYLYPD